MSLTLLQELVCFPITPDNKSSDTGSDAGADGTLLSLALLLLLNEQLAAHTRPEERQQVPTAVPAADDKAAKQVRQSPPAWQPQHAASPTSALMLRVSELNACASMCWHRSWRLSALCLLPNDKIGCLWTCRLTLHLYRSRAQSSLLQPWR